MLQRRFLKSNTTKSTTKHTTNGTANGTTNRNAALARGNILPLIINLYILLIEEIKKERKYEKKIAIFIVGKANPPPGRSHKKTVRSPPRRATERKKGCAERKK